MYVRIFICENVYVGMYVRMFICENVQMYVKMYVLPNAHISDMILLNV